MTMIYFLKLTLAIVYRGDWKGIRGDMEIVVLRERINGVLNLGNGCEAKCVNLRYI